VKPELPLSGNRVDTQPARLVIELRDLIMKGAFAAGERLVEASLSGKLQASRNPLRSALLMPEQEGLAQMPFGGVKVSGMGRFGGKAGIAEFTDLRWMTVQTGPRHYPF
jgi:DNA-binding GntR family transcriptional regulator